MLTKEKENNCSILFYEDFFHYNMKFWKISRICKKLNFFRGNKFSRIGQNEIFREHLISRIGGPFAKFAKISGRENFWH